MLYRTVRFACAATLVFVAVTTTGVNAQTITYKGDVKLPVLPNGFPIQLMNDSGLTATDLDVPSDTGSTFTNTRILAHWRAAYGMYNDENGKPYFKQLYLRSNLRIQSLNERHNNVNPTYLRDTIPSITGNYGLGVYRILTHPGDNPYTNVGATPYEPRSIVHGGVYNGKTNTIFATNSLGSLGLYSLTVDPSEGSNQTPFMMIPSGTPASDLALSGLRLAQTFGTDGNLYVLDTDGKRVMSFDLGLHGGTRGAFLNSFLLDPTKAADNSLTMDFAGNLYVGDGQGGFSMYNKDGKLKTSFADVYTPDPYAETSSSGRANSYMNFYASGLNDGKGTLDIYDVTGYRQYSIGPSGVPEPASWAMLMMGFGVIGGGLRYRRRQSGTANSKVRVA